MRPVRALSRRIVTVVWSGALALLIAALAGGVWVALTNINLRTNPGIPWSVPAMGAFLWVLWQYLNGRWWPRSTSQARRRYLRANSVSWGVFAWALVAGALSIVALAGYWIVLFQLVKMPPNGLPNVSDYPWITVALGIGMGSLVAPISEEAGFRGYCHVALEREFPAWTAVFISSVLFSLAHAPTYGFLWPKLSVYFLAGVTFGAVAYLTSSILPAIAVHIPADLTFFIFVWPHDAARRQVREGGADAWFWSHAAQAIVFTALAIVAFQQLAKMAKIESVRTSNLEKDAARFAKAVKQES